MGRKKERMMVRIGGMVVFCVGVACAALPSWVGLPQSDTPEMIYGVGEGESLKVAREDALNAVASKLGVTISSTLTKNTTQTTIGSSIGATNDVTLSLKSVVKPLTFGSYDIVQTAVEGGRTYLLVGVNKKRFCEEKKGEIAHLEEEINKKLVSLRTQESAQKFQTYEMLMGQTQEALRLATIVSSLDRTYMLASHQELADKVQQRYETFLEVLSVVIVGDVEDKPFVDVLKKGAGNQKMRVSSSPVIGALEMIRIEVESNIIAKDLFGRHLVKAHIAINLKTKGGETLKTSTFVSQGSSAIDTKTAIYAAAKEFEKQIEKEGFLSLLGGEK